MKPFLKWAGGKYRLLDILKSHFPQGKRFVEPFLGSGAVSLNVDYPEILAGDVNPALIGLWQTLQSKQIEFINSCKELFDPRYNTIEEYNRLREEFNTDTDTDVEHRSCLFIYLNRHGFNGLCRFNKSGKFNVPFGRYTRPYFPERELLHALEVSKRMDIIHNNFQSVFDDVREGDVVYADPPYVPLTPTASFTSYSADGFGMDEQLKLVHCVHAAKLVGATVIVSNHDTPITRDLYKNADEIHTLQVQRNISCNGAKREKVAELIAVFKP